MKSFALIVLFFCLSASFAADTLTTSVNQQANGGQWNSLGVFYFDAGDAGSLTVRNDATNGYVIVDAVMFRKDTVQQIVDNTDPSGVSITGTWTSSSSTPGFIGTNYIHDNNADKGAMRVRFVPFLPDTGHYEVLLRWTDGGNRASIVPVDIIYNAPSARYPLTVINGNGSGSYICGQAVSIIANVPDAGKVFYRWMAHDSSLFRGYGKVTASFPMPGHSLTATAMYADSDVPVTSLLIGNLKLGHAQTMVTYGTSITAGGIYQHQLDSICAIQYPGHLTIVNSGGSGMNSRWGITNLDNYVLACHPDAVFIEFAINDAAHTIVMSVDSSKINLNTMIDRILAGNPDCQIFPMTMNPVNAPGFSPRDSLEDYYEGYRDVAAQRGLLLIDNYAVWKPIFDNDMDLFLSYTADGLHPNALGISTIVTPTIMKALDPSDTLTTSTNSLSQSESVGIPEITVRPNPFNPRVTIRLSNAGNAPFRLVVYDLTGHCLATLSDAVIRGTIVWDARDRISGLYIVRITVGHKVFSRKIMLVK
ncbi:MAG: hypothetical protein A2487_14840 [Candidatus Raymondbacteria bacterium RifOxyC12_full_50_8]|uniref:SGNH hydrolase-type esterase domain-containing protein n=1 Tax=Candidatus Raymondbacteria bacterium RIFOXYD12_FULL_49_13 TaxID=1817890 RepID=A0A1F7FI96_UNCRA|nr:MAG: hypothetical protein A2248_21370 [Candidatus Raymondbacteria bacterium RIFOXYA2_FULL_49_16]OGJ97434.1 MAG: hypothetical protein A2487_14840 [Candidatus Raymondbacteria bacterium RifOxyC12_full_50_8]OGJ98658.1 MAG: hypothetical protein A2350_14020 [Candidatus Raymondbacteria bacterium RifOxyB12_full_50_8]OGK06338.1 MAG: hypothetical protein A2519_08690 [Candidatus Raymondbacteria bacterium RIFOXYD12_FULL_49_13]OGP40672.1 MAG: hypothetical protein A2324_03440 [Candidatus Raymondbacteria b